MAAVSKASVSRQPLLNFCANINYKIFCPSHLKSRYGLNLVDKQSVFIQKRKGFPFNQFQLVIMMSAVNLKGNPLALYLDVSLSTPEGLDHSIFRLQTTALIQASFRFNKLISDSLNSCTMMFFF